VLLEAVDGYRPAGYPVDKLAYAYTQKVQSDVKGNPEFFAQTLGVSDANLFVGLNRFGTDSAVLNLGSTLGAKYDDGAVVSAGQLRQDISSDVLASGFGYMKYDSPRAAVVSAALGLVNQENSAVASSLVSVADVPVKPPAPVVGVRFPMRTMLQPQMLLPPKLLPDILSQ